MRRLHPLIVLLLLSFTQFSVAGRILVGKQRTVQTIKGAIAIANPGDTILIAPGTYKEGNIILDKSLVILGQGLPVLDGENKFEIFTVHANQATIQGLKFINTGVASISDIAAIKVLDSRRIRIVDNELENTFFGIYLANTTDSEIRRNKVVSNSTNEFNKGNGIHLWKCRNITIHSNSVKGHRDGIYFEFVTSSLITQNHSEGNQRYGLHFMFSHNDEYRNNTFIDNGAGVAVMYSKEVTMLDNKFQHNWGSASYGLLLKDIRDSHVSGNQFFENSVGIFMEGCSRIEFRSNSFDNNGYALRLQSSCDDNDFTLNNFQGNTFDLVTNGTLVLNKITGNYWDKYEGYDLDHNMVGDVPYRPVSLYGMIIEQTPTAVLLWRSFLVHLIDKAEKAIPVITPENLMDNSPSMKPYDIVR